jgi:hypothetical protein
MALPRSRIAAAFLLLALAANASAQPAANARNAANARPISNEQPDPNARCLGTSVSVAKPVQPARKVLDDAFDAVRAPPARPPARPADTCPPRTAISACRWSPQQQPPPPCAATAARPALHHPPAPRTLRPHALATPPPRRRRRRGPPSTPRPAWSSTSQASLRSTTSAPTPRPATAASTPAARSTRWCVPGGAFGTGAGARGAGVGGGAVMRGREGGG